MNALATLSVIFAFVVPPAGAVLGHVALSQIKKHPQPGRQRAILGATLSYVMTVVLVVALAVWLTVGRDDPDARPSTASPPTTSSMTTSSAPPTTSSAPTDLTGAVIDRDTVDPWLGDWTGSVSQASVSAYTVNMHLAHDGRTVVGTVDYPELSCSGRLDHAALSGNVLSVQENIDVNTAGRCITPVTLSLALNPGEVVYSFDSQGGGSAVLHRK